MSKGQLHLAPAELLQPKTGLKISLRPRLPDHVPPPLDTIIWIKYKGWSLYVKTTAYESAARNSPVGHVYQFPAKFHKPGNYTDGEVLSEIFSIREHLNVSEEDAKKIVRLLDKLYLHNVKTVGEYKDVRDRAFWTAKQAALKAKIAARRLAEAEAIKNEHDAEGSKTCAKTAQETAEAYLIRQEAAIISQVRDARIERDRKKAEMIAQQERNPESSAEDTFLPAAKK